MANSLMFEVGIKSAQEQLDKIKQEFTKANGELTKLLDLKVKIDGVDAITKALNQIGDSTSLRNLRNEVAALNREFSILSKGAGGTGDIAGRGVAADIERTSQSIDRYTTKIRELTEERQRLVGGTRNSSYQTFTDEILRYQQSLEGARNKLAQLNEQKNKPVNGESLKKSTQDAQAFETAISRIETAIGGLKSGLNVNLSGDFAKWAQEVQNVTASIRELVEQLQKMHTVTTAALQSTQQLSQAEQKGALQNGLFDSQKFASLQEAIDKIISEINRLQQAFTKLGENSSLSNLSTIINGLAVTLSSLSSAINLSPTSEYVKKLQTDFEAAQAKVQELTEKLTALAAVQNQVAETAAKAGKSEQQIGDSQTALFNRYNKLLADIQNIKREIVEIQRGAGAGGPFGDKLGEYFSSLNRIRNVAREITSSPSVADAITKGMSSEQLAKLNSALAALKTNYKEVIADAKDFNKATDKGSSQAEARIRKLGMAFNDLKNYMRQNGGSEEMKRLQTEIQGAIRKMRDLMNAGNFAGAVNVYERLSGIIRQAAQATKEFEKAQQGVSSTVSQTTAQLHNQSQVLSDLKTMAMQYLSVWGAQSFINNIIELGGQLEQQRLSIGAILQDTAQANHLFGQIKDLAIRSPFGVQQLDAMTKQLSAYGFQYSELYEWTKRLADISAATGTSVDRLALALGHVRSEGALSGYTLRQFSMGNIPLLQKLSENLGKTKQEIRKMTRNKEIGYEDVLNVLKQLTDESGMFYQAQETMAEALNAKFKNLRDSFQIMYSEMAEGAPGDFLKGVAEVLTDISKSWRVLMPVILSGAGAMGVLKASTMLMNYELAKEGVLTSKAAAEKAKYTAATNAQIAATGRWALALKGLGRVLSSLGRFVFNPITLGFAAVEGLIYLWSKHNDEVRKAEELTKAFGETAVESQKNIGKMLENIEPYSDGMDDSAMKAGIDSMTEAIKNYGVNGQKTLNDIAESADTVTEKYKLMREELEKTSKVYDEMKRTADAFEYGIRETDGGWFDDDVQTDLTQYANALKSFEDELTKFSGKYGDVLKNAVEAAEKADPAFREATKNMDSYSKKLAELWANTDKYQSAMAAARPIYNNTEWRDVYYGGEGFLNLNSKRKEAMQELDAFVAKTEEKLREKGYDFTKELAPEQMGALLKESKDWLEKHPEWENIYSVIQKKLEEKWKIKFEPDAEELPEKLSGWQLEVQKWLKENGLKIPISPSDSHEDFIKKVQSLRDAAQTAMDTSGKVLIGIGFKLDALPEELPSPLATPWNQSHFDTYKTNKNKIDLYEKLRSSFNFEWKDKNKKNPGSSEDKEAKVLRERVRILKEAADSYQYWREKVGERGAETRMQGEFGQLLTEQNLQLKNADELKTKLKELREEYSKKPQTKAMVEAIKEIDKEIAKLDRKDFERDTEKWVSALTRDLDELTRKWDIFNSVVSSTGDRMLAARLTGITPGATPADLKRLNIAQFAGANIDFDSLLGMSDEQIDRYVEKLNVPEEKIKAIQNGLKDWKKAQEDVTKSDIQSYAQWLGGLVDLESIRTRNQEEYNKVLEETNRLLKQGLITQEEADRRKKAASVRRDTRNWQATSMYANLYNRSQVMAEGEFYEAYNKERANLFDQYKQGAIDIKEYTEKMRKLNDVASEFSSRGFLGIKGGVGAFLSGGYQGLINYRKTKADELRSQGKEDEAKQEEDKAASMEKQLKAANQVVQAFQELATGADLLGDLFSSMGWSDGANAMSDAGSLINKGLSGASSLSMLGPWGMAAGAGIGLVSGIFSLYDTWKQREIDALKENANALKENTDSLKASRERTLGYDVGELRKRMAQNYDLTALQHKHVDLGISELDFDMPDFSQIAMWSYYVKNSNRSSYEAELENLKEQRKYYLEMYNLENEKKNVSNEALREYREKIAELDDQILFFVEDLTNELWGIDFKGWASQISDALWTAFENGEDALDAFHDTAKDIIADVAKRMMNIHLIEPVFSKLEDQLFGEIGSNGQRTGGVAYNFTTGQFNEEETLRILGQFFGEDGEFAKVISSAEDFYKMTERATGFDFASEDSSRSTSSGIKSITEQTADILAGYVNSIRADVSVNRNMIAQYFPMYYNALTSGNASLANIENHTAAIMRSNDAIERSNQAILENINGLKNKTWKLPMA